MKTTVQKIIIKHYKKRTKTRNWECCGMEIQQLICNKTEALRQTDRYNSAIYPKQCEMEAGIRKNIEREYESYFSFTNAFGITAGYDWINGNQKLKSLLS